jgi:hypothetical protein
MCDILRVYLAVRNIFSTFAAEFATLWITFRRTNRRKFLLAESIVCANDRATDADAQSLS